MCLPRDIILIPFGTPGLSDKAKFFFLLVFTSNEDTGQDLSAFGVQLLHILVQDSSRQSILAHHSFQSRCSLITTIALFEKGFALCSCEHILF
jgi:mannitol/fructose-specific phosphotransferase system IIA component (Ntr-type)